jgi:hypothetical protein
MNSKRKNIAFYIVVILLTTFSISFAHTIIEQTGSSCLNHEDHDFSKVIVNVVIKDNSTGDNDLTFIDFNYVADYLLALPAIFTSNDFSGYFHNPPLLFSNHIYITKFKSLLI